MTSPPRANDEFVKLFERLQIQKKELKKSEVSKGLQTSFLRKDVFNLDVVYRHGEAVLETMDEMARCDEKWYEDRQTLELIYNILCCLQSKRVVGDPEPSIYTRNPVVCLVYIFAFLIYYPVMAVLMILLMLGRIQAWITLITGFTGALVSAVSLADEDDDSATLDQVSRVLGIITGVLAAAKGITLENEKGKSDFLYTTAEELTAEVLRRAWGNISENPVFKNPVDGQTYHRFSMTLTCKKDDVKKVKDVRVFLAVVRCTNLVPTGSDVHYMARMMTLSKQIEGALIDPYNYLTLEELGKNNYDIFKFGARDVREIENIWSHIFPLNSFCDLLQGLNNGTVHFPLPGTEDPMPEAAPRNLFQAAV